MSTSDGLSARRNVNATRLGVATFGIIAGVAGVEHGIGEILQGNVAPAGMMILSWPDSKFFSVLAGEPAMTLVPNLLLTGILAVLVSLIFSASATRFVQHRYGGLVLILLSILWLLVGGGFGPPLVGITLGAAATWSHSPAIGLFARLPTGLQRFLTMLWSWLFVVCVGAWLALFPGLSVLAYLFGVDDSNLTAIVSLLALGSLVLTLLTGLAYDSAHSGLRLQQEQRPLAPAT